MTERESWEHYVGLNWTDRFSDPVDEEEEKVDDKIFELSHYEEDFCPKADFSVKYFAKEGDDFDTCFEIHGWANESVYEELLESIDYYGLKLSKIA